MTKWRLAKSLERLRGQINEKWPHRSKISDGTIGNAEHATRSSDHNPWVKDSHGVGIVTAIDITNDPNSAPNSRALAQALVASRDPRIKYIISNGEICSSKIDPWEWRKYKGSNLHFHHVHISVMADVSYYDSTVDWKF